MRRHLAALGAAVMVAALLSVAVPAAASGATCPDENLVPDGGNLPRVEDAVLCAVNRERAAAGLVALSRASKLDLSARFHTVAMVRRRFLAHEVEGHPTLLARIRGYGYFAGARDGIYAENLGVGPTTNGTARSIVDAWMGSSTHRSNILHAPFRDIGIAAVPAPPHPAFYANFPSTVYTTDFGTRFVRQITRKRRRCVIRRTVTTRRTNSATPRRRYCRRPARRSR